MSMHQDQTQAPKESQSVITLDDNNSIHILAKYVEFAQEKGAFLLNEAEVLKRSADCLLLNVQDNEINHNMAKQLLIQGVNKGQKHGAYTLNDAALLSKVVQFVASSLSQPETKEEHTDQDQEEEKQHQQDEDDDLFDLSEPIPLRPKEV